MGGQIEYIWLVLAFVLEIDAFALGFVIFPRNYGLYRCRLSYSRVNLKPVKPERARTRLEHNIPTKAYELHERKISSDSTNIAHKCQNFPGPGAYRFVFPDILKGCKGL